VATAFAMQFGSDSDFTTSVTLVSTVLSTVTLTLILLLLGGPTV
jgi:predicted permease